MKYIGLPRPSYPLGGIIKSQSSTFYVFERKTKRMKINRLVLFSISLFCIFGCTTPKAYLNEAIDIIANNSIDKYKIDWDRYREDVLEYGKKARTVKETYPAIQYALSKVGNGHSFLISSDQYKSIIAQDKQLSNITSQLFDDKIAYIKIPGFLGIEGFADKFAQQIQDKIKEFDNNNVESWVIDLSDNPGGNMWPMLLGLGPILGEDTLGYFMNADRNFTPWIYANGSVFIGDEKIMTLSNPYILKNHIKSIAVIISNKTGSSGEAIATAFIGADNCKFFGERTHGFSTGNADHKLSDGAVIILTESKFVDRNMVIYGKSIQPDVGDSSKSVINTAIKWINDK